MVRIEAHRSSRPVPAPKEKIRARTPKIPAFFEAKDVIDSYFLRFERYASKKGTWATDLSALLQGKAIDVYALR